MYKLIAIDMDGTLLNSENQVSDRNRQAIERAKAKGVKVVLATGRILKSAAFYAENLGLFNPIISCNGAIIIDESKNIVYDKAFNKDLAEKVLNLAEEYNMYHHFYDEENFYANVLVDEVVAFYNSSKDKLSSQNIDFRLYKDKRELLDRQDFKIYKMMFMDEDINKLQLFRSKLEEIQDLSVSSSWANNIELMAGNISKGEGVRYLCEKLNIDPKHVIAIGDNENDIPMIQFAGLGVGMGNGTEKVKEYADYITDINDNDGVAKVIEKFVL